MSFPQHWQKLIDDGHYAVAHEYGNAPGPDAWPEDIPHEKDGINVDRRGRSEQFLATSTRLIIVGRESYTARPLKGGFGFVCAENVRPDKRTGKIPTKYVFGGGKLNQDFDTREGDEYQIEENVRDCAVREGKEEIGIELKPDNLFLFGVRMITTGNSNDPEWIRGCKAADALFFAFRNEKLGYFEGKRTEDARGIKERETGERQVRSAAELLYLPTEQELRSGVLRPLFQSQAAALAIGIIAINDLLHDDLPDEWKALIDESLPHARAFLKRVERLDRTTTRLIQQRPWLP